ncbi:MAG: phasin family protein [Hyphomicrobiaceae bacterium]|nr:phasin family protein [Hyphomicrobiaceae bacterium]
MNTQPHLEVPEAVRKMAEQNISQAREAYDRFMGMARQAQQMMNGSSGFMTDAAKDLQSRAMQYTEANMEAGFDFLTELSKARDLKEYLEIQSRHTQRSIKNYGEQAQELGRLIGEVARNPVKR